MVTTEIPKHYTASPSSLNGTPHLTINREIALDLDSTNAFEGMSHQYIDDLRFLIISQDQRNS